MHRQVPNVGESKGDAGINHTHTPSRAGDAEKYTLLGPGLVLVECKNKIVAIVSCNGHGRLICNCMPTRRRKRCDHINALMHGLYGHLAALPMGQPFLTRTRDWCKCPVPSAPFIGCTGLRPHRQTSKRRKGAVLPLFFAGRVSKSHQHTKEVNHAN